MRKKVLIIDDDLMFVVKLNMLSKMPLQMRIMRVLFLMESSVSWNRNIVL